MFNPFSGLPSITIYGAQSPDGTFHALWSDGKFSAGCGACNWRSPRVGNEQVATEYYYGHECNSGG